MRSQQRMRVFTGLQLLFRLMVWLQKVCPLLALESSVAAWAACCMWPDPTLGPWADWERDWGARMNVCPGPKAMHARSTFRTRRIHSPKTFLPFWPPATCATPHPTRTRTRHESTKPGTASKTERDLRNSKVEEQGPRQCCNREKRTRSAAMSQRVLAEEVR